MLFISDDLCWKLLSWSIATGYISDTLQTKGEEYFLIWTQFEMYYKADIFLQLLLNAKHLCL